MRAVPIRYISHLAGVNASEKTWALAIAKEAHMVIHLRRHEDGVVIEGTPDGRDAEGRWLLDGVRCRPLYRNGAMVVISNRQVWRDMIRKAGGAARPLAEKYAMERYRAELRR